MDAQNQSLSSGRAESTINHWTIGPSPHHAVFAVIYVSKWWFSHFEWVLVLNISPLSLFFVLYFIFFFIALISFINLSFLKLVFLLTILKKLIFNVNYERKAVHYHVFFKKFKWNVQFIKSSIAEISWNLWNN